MFDYVCRGRLTGSEKLSGLGVQVPRTDDVESIAPLFWADHCLECSPPACYASCELFEANEIGRCRRVDYMEIGRVPGFDFPVDHLRFRKWSKLRCAYNNSLSFDAQEFLTIYRRHESKVSAAKLADMPSRLFPHTFAIRFHVLYTTVLSKNTGLTGRAARADRSSALPSMP